jgi:hypothetical protein
VAALEALELSLVAARSRGAEHEVALTERVLAEYQAALEPPAGPNTPELVEPGEQADRMEQVESVESVEPVEPVELV